MQEILSLNPPSFLTNLPLLFDKPPKVPKKTLPGPKKVTDMTPKKKPCSEIYRTPLFCKKTGPIWYSLAWAASFLIYPSVYGVTTLCYISIPRWLEKYSTAMCYPPPPYGNVEQYFRTSFLKLLHELKIEEPSRLKESGIGISIHSIRVSILATGVFGFVGRKQNFLRDNICSWSWRLLSKSITRKGSDVPLSPPQRNPRKQGAGHIYHLSLFKVDVDRPQSQLDSYLRNWDWYGGYPGSVKI